MGFRFSTGVGPVRYSTRIGGGSGCWTVVAWALLIGLIIAYWKVALAILIVALAVVGTVMLLRRQRPAKSVENPEPSEDDAGV